VRDPKVHLRLDIAGAAPRGRDDRDPGRSQKELLRCDIYHRITLINHVLGQAAPFPSNSVQPIQLLRSNYANLCNHYVPRRTGSAGFEHMHGTYAHAHVPQSPCVVTMQHMAQ
jgi:hypothetical protein